MFNIKHANNILFKVLERKEEIIQKFNIASKQGVSHCEYLNFILSLLKIHSSIKYF